ncbi:NAD(+) diphosphatase [Marinomonas sp. 15G1-11]|uniref:NAD(+) diphosphatase n=1 Tax=Marinomonas phaeophyticola TaxID=3004091 RepID=A0ABT4JV81_9GAMM|nr:NAD(+) diphosphatase [Marinomonas sp. 15G1-11]MCZ2722145.1 NAD(+) diphosphatase [Marinomonas sp. 15G1-11]
MLTIGTSTHPRPHNEALFLLMHRGSILTTIESHDFLVTIDQFQPEAESQPVFCGEWHGKDVFACLLKSVPPSFQETDFRELLFSQDEAGYYLLSRSRQLATWDADHQFCGRCGTSFNKRHDTEHTKICPKCNLRHYPRISPCVIVAIRKENQILLARGIHSPPNRFSNIAGFVEAGESLEQAVVREVNEEVGIEVTNIQYTSSQPWSFPHQLMVGFLADYVSGEIIAAPGEIAEAGWYNIDQLPPIPPPATISGQIILEQIERIKQSQ